MVEQMKLEQAAEEWVKGYFDNSTSAATRAGAFGFIAGAEWQYQKDRGKFAQIKAKTWCEGFDACKEQIMKDAVEWMVTTNLANHPVIYYDDELSARGLKYGDKVKIIIIKED